MAYRLKRSQSVAKGVKRVARRELKKAAEQLRYGIAGEEPVHESRKSIKRVRALLRLIQDKLRPEYSRESSRLRQSGRALSPIRDAAALITAFDRLVKRKKVGNRNVPSMRRGLVEHKTRVEEKSRLDELRAATARALEQTRKSVGSWKIKRDGFRIIQGGLEKAFRRGRKAMGAALKKPQSRGPARMAQTCEGSLVSRPVTRGGHGL